MFPIKIKTWPGFRARVTKVSENVGYLQTNEAIEGKVFAIPMVGFRFRCGYELGQRGGISTNIVTKIKSFDKKKGGEFETYSGSVYKWEILEKYEDERAGMIVVEEEDCGSEQLRVIQGKFINPRIKK